MLYVFLTSCSNDVTNAGNKVRAKDSTPALPKVDAISFVSGNYQDISLAVGTNKTLTGVYEYRENWSEKYKSYINENVFYFFGKIINDSTSEINASWPTTHQSLKGKIITRKNEDKTWIEVSLNAQPLGYNDVDFTSSPGVLKQLDSPKHWIEIRVVKSERAKIFNLPDFTAAKKGYVVKNDIVKILSKKAEWCEVEYCPKNDRTKSTIMWLKIEDLSDIEPAKW